MQIDIITAAIKSNGQGISTVFMSKVISIFGLYFDRFLRSARAKLLSSKLLFGKHL